MKQVVTIDFDIIMAPSIELYNDRIGPHERDVEEVIRKFPCLNGMTANLDTFRIVTHFISRVDPSKISFITQHREMRDFIKEFDEPVELINIDHHHDICYHPIADDKWDSVGCGNWVKYLFMNNMIDKYVHIGDKLSAMPFPEDQHLVTEFLDINENSLDHLVDEIDELCICLSPAWVPSQYHGLFEAWATALGVMKNTKYKYK